MSGLDGLGWPNPKDEPKLKKTMNSQLEIKLAPTPQTDKQATGIIGFYSCETVPANFARNLERERDRYQESADALVDLLGATQERMINAERERDILKEHISIMDISHKTANDEYFELAVENEKLERKRDELREWASVNGVSSLAKDRDQFRAQLREEQQLHVQTLNERDEAQEQRDRLAAVLQRIRDGYGGQAAAPDCCEDCEFLIPIDEALQSLNQPTEMTDERCNARAGSQ